MNANKQDAGGLLPCPFCATEECGLIDTSHGVCGACGKCGTCGPFTTCKEDALAAWNRRELCRAAPAGGGAAANRAMNCGAAFQQQECAEASSAPAGSGEVEALATRLEREVRAWESWREEDPDEYPITTVELLRESAALLRKLQQGAEYSFRLLEVGEVMLASDEYVNDYGQWAKMAPPFIGMAYMLSMRTVRRRAASQGQEGGKRG